MSLFYFVFFFFFQAEDGIRDRDVTGVQTCALPICYAARVVPRFGPDAAQDLQREGIALRAVEHRTGVQERRGHHRVPVHVRGRVDIGGLPPTARGFELGDRLFEQAPLRFVGRVLLPPQHVLFMVVLHLAGICDVVYATDYVIRRFVIQRLLQFPRRPCPVIAVGAERDV